MHVGGAPVVPGKENPRGKGRFFGLFHQECRFVARPSPKPRGKSGVFFENRCGLAAGPTRGDFFVPPPAPPFFCVLNRKEPPQFCRPHRVGQWAPVKAAPVWKRGKYTGARFLGPKMSVPPTGREIFRGEEGGPKDFRRGVPAPPRPFGFEGARCLLGAPKVFRSRKTVEGRVSF